MSLRRAFFQVHLWLGIGTGIYVLAICLSGSAIVFRREMDQAFCPGTVVVLPSGRRQLEPACEPAFVTTLAEFHDHLLIGHAGLRVNGAGAMLVALGCVSGAVLWWTARRPLRYRVTIRRGVRGPQLLYDLHNVLGFWLFLVVALWALTGIYFAWPEAFGGVSDEVIAPLVRLHFGRAFGVWVKVVWVFLGLMPCALFLTGALMWWNRVVRRKRRACDD